MGVRGHEGDGSRKRPPVFGPFVEKRQGSKSLRQVYEDLREDFKKERVEEEQGKDPVRPGADPVPNRPPFKPATPPFRAPAGPPPLPARAPAKAPRPAPARAPAPVRVRVMQEAVNRGRAHVPVRWSPTKEQMNVLFPIDPRKGEAPRPRTAHAWANALAEEGTARTFKGGTRAIPWKKVGAGAVGVAAGGAAGRLSRTGRGGGAMYGM